MGINTLTVEYGLGGGLPVSPPQFFCSFYLWVVCKYHGDVVRAGLSGGTGRNLKVGIDTGMYGHWKAALGQTYHTVH